MIEAKTSLLRNTMQEELLELENEFARAVASNDVDALDGILADDWIIIDPDGSIIDKARFLGVIKSGVLSHESMESTDLRVRLYGNTAVVTGTHDHQREIHGTGFCLLRASDRYFCEANRSLAVRIDAANAIREKITLHRCAARSGSENSSGHRQKDMKVTWCPPSLVGAPPILFRLRI